MSDSSKPWVDPAALPRYGEVSSIAGNAPDNVKQLVLNTLGSYGIGEPDNFAYTVGKKIMVTRIDIEEKDNMLQATTESEVVVSKDMLNGARMMHGGCTCYIIDNCASIPLVALGVIKGVNGVGVSQMLTLLFHSPAPEGMMLRIRSSSVTLGGRIMSSRCEIVDAGSGRMVASAMLSKMQPIVSKL